MSEKKRINKNSTFKSGGGAKQKRVGKNLVLTIFIVLFLSIIIPIVSAQQEIISPIVHVNTELAGVDLTQAQVNDITNDDTTNIFFGKQVLLTTELEDTLSPVVVLNNVNCTLVYYTENGFADKGNFLVYDSFGGNVIDSVTITESVTDNTLNLIDLQTKGLSASEISTMIVYAENIATGASKNLYVDKIICTIDYDPPVPPSITSESITTDLTSGEIATVRANITDVSPISAVWFTINDTDGTLINYSMVQEGSSNFYNGTFVIGEIGTYHYKVYANNSYGSLNNTASWHAFSVSKPSATPENEDYPNKALPSSTIKITADLTAIDLLEDVYAYLNVPRKFLFTETSTYPQNQNKGNFSVGETKTATWLLYSPGTEASYSFNITWTDKYGNEWQGSNKNILVQWAVSQLRVSSDIGSFYSPNDEIDIYSTVTGSDGELVSAAVNVNATYPNGTQLSAGAATEVSIGRFKYNFILPSSASTGTYQVKIDATYGSNEAHEVRTFLISTVLEDISDVVDYINTTITNTIIPYLQEINQTTHTTYSYLTDTIKPQLDGIGENVSYIRDNMATSSALSNLQDDVTWVIDNVATQENITMLEGKINIIDSNVDNLITTTDCSNPSNSVLCTYLDNTNLTVTDIKNNWGSYTTEDIITRLNEVNTTTQNAYSYLQNEITTRLTELNTTTQNIYTDTQSLLAKWGTYTAQQLYNISNATYIRTGEIYNDMATSSALSNLQDGVTWLINNVVTQENITLINQKLDTINSTVNTIKTQTDCSNPSNSELCIYLNSINTTTNTIYSEMATYEQGSNILNNVTWLRDNVATSEAMANNFTDIKNRLTDMNITLWGVHDDLTSINTSLSDQISNIQDDVTWIKDNIATSEEIANNFTETFNRLTQINLTVSNTNTYLNEDITTRLTELNITTQNNYDYLQNTIYTKLNETWNNTQQTLFYIGNPSDDENQNTLFGEHTYTQNRLSTIQGNLTEIKTTVTQINITIEAINSTVSTILLEVDDLEELHQCSIIPNSTICNLLNLIRTDTQNIYILAVEINQTTHTTYSYLTDTIYPKLDTIENNTNNLLSNSTEIWNKLLMIEGSITDISVDTENLINITNCSGTSWYSDTSSLCYMLNDITTRLIEINTTTQTTLNNIVSVIIPQLITINTTVNTITEYTDTLENELNCVNPTDSDICFRLNLIQNYTINLETNLATLTNNLESHNSTVYSQLDNIITIINTINTNTDNIEGGQDNILNSLSQLQDNITMILNDLGIPPGSTLWGKLTSIESLATQINSTVNTINDNTDEVEILVREVINLVACTNSSSGTVCNKMNSLSTSINDLQTIMEQNQSTIYTKLVETFDQVTNTDNKVNDAINYLNCNTQSTDSVCWRLIDIQNRVDEINTTTWNTLNNITLIVIPKLNTIDTNTDEIEGYVDTLESSFNCSSFDANSICANLDTIKGYTDNVESDIAILSTDLANHTTSILSRLGAIDSNLTLIYNDTQFIRIQNFSGGGTGGGLTDAQNTVLYAIQTLTQDNQNLLLSINQTVNEIQTIQQTSLVTGALKVEHSTVSEYRRGEEGSSVVLVTLNGVPISGVSVKGDYYYPNQSLWLDDVVFTEIESTGVYYYNFTVPITSPEGVYKVKITGEQSTGGSSASDNFDDGNADGWSTTGATYVVVDEGAPQNYVYQKTDYGGFMFAWSTAMGSQTDYTLTAKARSDGYQGYFGLTFRYLDSGNNYIVYVRQGANNLRLMKHTNGGTATLSETPYGSLVTNDGQWYNFTVVVEGAHFLIYVDDVLYIDYTDIGSPHETGYVGAFTYNSIASWDDFNVIASGTVDSAYSMIDFKIDDTVVEAIDDVKNELINRTNYLMENYRIELSDFPEIVAGKTYRAQLNVFNSTGRPTNLSSLPTITVYDPLRVVDVDEESFSWVSEGVYNFSYVTSISDLGGLYESVVSANYSGETVVLNDYWRISSSPADIAINSITDNSVPTIIANVDVENKGTQDSDFIVTYCIVDKESNLCGGDDDIDYKSVTKYILAGQTLNLNLGLSVPSVGPYYYKAKTRALSEANWAGASQFFTAVEGAGTPGEPGGGTGGGGGGTPVTPVTPPITGEVVEGKLFDVNINILDKYKKIFAGNTLASEITIYNVGEKEGKRDTLVTYFIKDLEGKILTSEFETIAVNTKTNFVKEILVPKSLEPGEYIFEVEVRYNSLIAKGSSTFNIIEKAISGKEEEKVPTAITVPSYWPIILIILIVLGLLTYLGIKKKEEIKELFRKKHRAKEKVTAYNILNAKNIIIAVLAVIVLASVLFNISIKEIPSKIINILSAVKLPSISLNWWFVFGALLILFLAGIFVVLIFILKEIRKLTAGKGLKPQHKFNKKMLLISGFIVLVVLFLLLLFSNPSITGNVVGSTDTGNINWLFGFILIIGIIGLLIFSSKKKNKEIFQEVRNIREKPIIEKKTETKSSYQDTQNLQSAGFKVKPTVRDKLEKMQGLDKPSPSEIRTNVYKMLEDNGIDVGDSTIFQKSQKTEQPKPEIQAKRISTPTNKQSMLNQLKGVYK